MASGRNEGAGAGKFLCALVAWFLSREDIGRRLHRGAHVSGQRAGATPRGSCAGRAACRGNCLWRARAIHSRGQRTLDRYGYNVCPRLVTYSSRQAHRLDWDCRSETMRRRSLLACGAARNFTPGGAKPSAAINSFAKNARDNSDDQEAGVRGGQGSRSCSLR